MKPVIVVSAMVFAAVATGHALRLVLGWDVRIGAWDVPRWISVLGVAAPACLAVGLARAARGWERTWS